MARIEIAEPELLKARHIVAGFVSGNASLDDWLVHRALANQTSGASRTFVALVADEVAGYYALAGGSIALVDAPSKLRRNMPEPIPVVLLGRLAVASKYQGQGVGAFLLERALRRSMQSAESVGLAGVLVHAVDEPAKAFYLKFGFLVSPTRPLTLVFPFKGADF